MSFVQEDNVVRARDNLLAHLAGPAAVILCGSTLTPYGDAYSTLDFLVLGHGTTAPTARRPVRTGRLRYHYFARPFDAFAAAVQDYEDEALFLLRHGRVVHDPDGQATALWTAPPSVPPAVWIQKVEACHREYRRRRASLAWTLRRGQPLLILDNVGQLLGHALAICCYLEAEPPPDRKWLLRAALRTPLGRQIRPLVLELLAALGNAATFGGHDNSVFVVAGRIQEALEGVRQGVRSGVRSQGERCKSNLAASIEAADGPGASAVTI